MKKNLSHLILSLMAFIGVVGMAQANNIVVENSAGKQEVPQHPQRIVVLDFAAADTLRELGAAQQIVGIPQGGRIPAYLSEFADKKYTNVGTLPEPAFERINSLKPDLIIASPRQKKILENLKEIAPVFYIQDDFSQYFHSFQQNVLALSQIVGKESLAKQKLAELEQGIQNLAGKTKGKTALLTLVNESKISAYGDNSRYALVYSGYGFTPADPNIQASTHGMSIGFEYILEKNPDYLLVVDRTAAVTDKTNNAQKVLDNGIIQQTKAYKNHHILYLNAENWYLAFGGLQSMQIMLDEVKPALMP